MKYEPDKLKSDSYFIIHNSLIKKVNHRLDFPVLPVAEIVPDCFEVVPEEH